MPPVLTSSSSPAAPSSSSAGAHDSREAQQWFREEVYAHDRVLQAYVRNAYPSVRDVEDVVQESYLRVWRARATASIRSAKAFLFQIARHVAVDLIRHESVSPVSAVADLAALPVLDDRPDAAARACSQEELKLLADAIEALPSRCREVFILRKLQQVPQKEIAARLGLSEQTVQCQVQRAMKRLEAYLAERGL